MSLRVNNEAMCTVLIDKAFWKSSKILYLECGVDVSVSMLMGIPSHPMLSFFMFSPPLDIREICMNDDHKALMYREVVGECVLP